MNGAAMIRPSLPFRQAAAAALVFLVAACAGRDEPAPVDFRGAQPAEIALPAGASEIVVERGDTLYAIARRNNVPLRALIEANHLEPPYTIYPGNRLVLPANRIHTVRQNETLYGISRAYGVEMTALAQANGLQPPYPVSPGQRLVVPEGQGPGTQAAAEAVAAAGPEGRPPSARIDGAETISVSSAVGGTAIASTGGTATGATGISAAPLPPPGTEPSGTETSSAASTTVAPVAAAPVAAGEPATGGAPVTLTPGAETTAPPPAAPAAPAAEPAPQPAPAPAEPPKAEPAPAPAPAAPAQPAAEPAPAPVKAKPVETGDLGPAPKRFVWPVNGRVVSGYGDKAGGLHNDGVNIQAPRGTPIRAAADGVVVYAGSDLKGFGNMLLIRHGGNWLTAYAHAQAVLVDRGQRVKQGEVIARVGSSGNVDQPQLHFELRRGREAVDPERYLPRR
jgi:murein DD-endopeptidase MepM/ murein hydrolase activator NlpD